jgi:DNA-binding Lrp family transcriptional regulator
MAKGEHPQLDTLDRMFVACLQANGRASWSTIAMVSGASETTVARRVQQMTDSGILRIVGVLDAFRTGLGMPMLVRISCTPGMADLVADAIAARDDVRFVTTITGVADCVAEFIVPDRSALHRVLTYELSAVEGVRSSDSLVVLRTFRAAQQWDPRLLDRESIARLQSHEVVPFEDGTLTAVAELDEVDHAIARAFGEDGRMPYRDVAARVGVSETTVARRVDSLISTGCLHFRTLIAPALLGYETEVMLWLTVDARHLDRVGRRLAEEPSVRYLVATAGSYHLAGRVALSRHQDLYGLLTEKIGSLPGVRDVDVTFELQTLKRSWVLGTDPVLAGRPH